MHHSNDVNGAAEAQLVAAPRAPDPVARANLRIVCVFAVIDGMDLALLPASFRALEVAFGFSPAHLAALSAVQGGAQALAAPFWGALADNGAPRKLLMAVGCLLWAVLLVLMAFAADFHTMLFLRLLNGLALGMFTPLVTAIVAELSPPVERGSNFGLIEFFRFGVGTMPTTMIVTSISNDQIFGMMGWRVGFLVVAACGCCVAAVILSLFHEEPREWRPERISVLGELRKLAGYWMIPTFRVIAIQGMFKEIRMNALHFMAMYFQYLGLRDTQAGFLVSMYTLFTGFGYLVGGSIADQLVQWSPFHGRALTAQISVALSIPILVLLFGVVPQTTELNAILISLVIGLGLVAMWPKTGCNKPILTEIVPSDCIASACAWDRCLENFVGMTIGPAIVGYLSGSVFGYEATELQVADMPLASRVANANALSHSLLASTVGPEVICFCFYCFLHYTYQHDILVEGRFAGLGEKPKTDSKLPTEKTALA